MSMPLPATDPPAPVSLSVVVPCYNESGAVAETVKQLCATLEPFCNFELIFVNDGSSDDTGEQLESLAAEVSHLRVLHHPKNRGYGASLKTGIRRARGELIAITDADGTYPNERLPELVSLCVDQDMVVGARTSDEVTYPLIRKIPKLFLSRYVSWLADQKVPDMNSGMRVFRREVVVRFLSILPDTFSFTTSITILMIRNGYLVRYVPIRYAARVGNSKIKPIRDTLRFVQLITRAGMYYAPMRVLMPLTMVLALGFFVSLGYDLYRWDLTESTLLLLLFTMNTGMFALLADMIDKRSGA